MERLQKVYIGNSSCRGIASYYFLDGELFQEKWTEDEKKCTYLTKDASNIYGVIEENNEKGGYVVSYKIDDNGIEKVDKKPSNGKGPCHIEIDDKSKLMAISHYNDGYFCVRKLNENKTIGEIVYEEKAENQNSHIHCFKFKDEYGVKVDLGNDKIILYKIDQNTFIKKGEYYFKKDVGPRHIVLDEDRIYVITEKSCELYDLILKDDEIKENKCIPLLNNEINEESTGCAIKISRDRKNIYVSLRGKDLIYVFRIEKELKLIQTISSKGKLPWDIGIDKFDKYVLVANASSNNISIFSRNVEDGKLTYLDDKYVESPTCILF